MAKKHDERTVIEQLSKISGVSVNQGQKQVRINSTAIVGIHSWGKIDYLTNHCGYSAIRER
jgi:hypothetical protein